MRIVVIGVSGYVGPVLTANLRVDFPHAHILGLDSGWFMDQNDAEGPPPEAYCSLFFQKDVRNLTVGDLSEATHIIYLAAISNDPMGRRFEALTAEVNHRQAVRVASLAKASGAKSFVYASSASVYGQAQEPRREQDLLNPQTAYAKSKVDAEEELRGLADNGFMVTCLRFATACGWSPRVRLDLVLNDFVASALTTGKIEMLTDGSAWRPFIHVRDMARAIAWSISEERHQHDVFLTINVGSDEWNFSIKALAEAVAQRLKNRFPIEVVAGLSVDSRNYRLDFSHWRQLAPHHQPTATLDEAVDELAESLGRLSDLDENFRSSRRMRLVRLEQLISSGQLDTDLMWTRT